MTHAAMRAVSLTYRRLLPSILRGCLLSIIVIGPGLMGQQLSVEYAYPWLALTVSSFAAIVLLMLIIRFLPQLLGQETQAMLMRFLPGFVRRPHQDPKRVVAVYD
jgi:hypothetical protein